MHVVFLTSSSVYLTRSTILKIVNLCFVVQPVPVVAMNCTVQTAVYLVKLFSDEYDFSAICFPQGYVWILILSVLLRREFYLCGYCISIDTIYNVYIIIY